MATLEQTTCYKCEAEIQAEAGQVHPLCEECGEDFDSWFESQLGVFK